VIYLCNESQWAPDSVVWTPLWLKYLFYVPWKKVRFGIWVGEI